MTAAIAEQATTPVAAPPASAVPGAAAPSQPAPSAPVRDNDAAQRRAESVLLHRALLGGAIGAVVCAAIWVGLVAIAIAGNGQPLVPTLGMAAGCGVFAGLFLGGCAGALAGSHALEQVEHDRMHGH